jgi:hypothetical protein
MPELPSDFDFSEGKRSVDRKKGPFVEIEEGKLPKETNI